MKMYANGLDIKGPSREVYLALKTCFTSIDTGGCLPDALSIDFDKIIPPPQIIAYLRSELTEMARRRVSEWRDAKWGAHGMANRSPERLPIIVMKSVYDKDNQSSEVKIAFASTGNPIKVISALAGLFPELDISHDCAVLNDATEDEFVQIRQTCLAIV